MRRSTIRVKLVPLESCVDKPLHANDILEILSELKNGQGKKEAGPVAGSAETPLEGTKEKMARERARVLEELREVEDRLRELEKELEELQK